MSTRHVVVVTYGEPPSPSFTDQLIYSWRILQGLTRKVAEIPVAAIPAIALSRAYGRRRLWRSNRYTSPLEAITEAQAVSIRHALEHLDGSGPWAVHVAYEFRRPRLDEVIRALPANEPVWVAPLYAVDSTFTHALSRRTVADVMAGGTRSAPVKVLPSIETDLLASVSAQHVLDSVGTDGAKLSTAALVLAAHGSPLEPARPIETGRAGTERLCEAIRTRLAPVFGMVANGWLNHSRGGRWTEPPIEQTLERVRDAGYSDVVYFPYGFLADNAESQLEGRLAAAGRPELAVRFLPCLNQSADLANAIAVQVTQT